MAISSKTISQCLVISILFLLWGGCVRSYAFPFRAIAPGRSLPPIVFKGIDGHKTLSLRQMKGRPYIIIFWGADLPAKKRRSLKTIEAVEELLPFFERRGITVFSVNAQGDDKQAIEEIMRLTKRKIDVYTDPTQKAYGELGIFVMPAVLLVDKNGKVFAGLGYSHDLAERLKGEVQVMLGERSREQVERELHPVIRKKPKKERDADRHFNMGLVMLQRGLPDSAASEFKKAIALDPKMGKAYMELGCLLVDAGKRDKAADVLEKGLELEPNYVPGLICQARLEALQGNTKEAIDDLESLLMRNVRNPQLHYALGTIFEQQGNLEKAAKEYRKAFELLNEAMKLK